MRRFLTWYLGHDTDRTSSRTPITFLIGVLVVCIVGCIMHPIANMIVNDDPSVPIPLNYLLALIVALMGGLAVFIGGLAIWLCGWGVKKLLKGLFNA